MNKQQIKEARFSAYFLRYEADRLSRECIEAKVDGDEAEFKSLRRQSDSKAAQGDAAECILRLLGIEPTPFEATDLAAYEQRLRGDEIQRTVDSLSEKLAAQRDREGEQIDERLIAWAAEMAAGI